MKIADYSLVNIGPTPREIKHMRKSVMDFHSKLGQPVVFKHRWNLDDLSKGLCQKCPFHDDSYERSKTDCKYCFGTGFLGGFADGVIIFATIADAPTEQLKISPQGYILFDRHPQFKAPWYPDMGNGDLIITANFDRATWSVLSTGDVFELKNVAPVTVRGLFGVFSDYKLFKVEQSAEIDRVLNDHIYYNVPITFNYDNIPVVIPPSGALSGDYKLPYASILVGLKIIGQEGGLTSTITQPLFITGGGTTNYISQKLSITGDGSTVVNFE